MKCTGKKIGPGGKKVEEEKRFKLGRAGNTRRAGQTVLDSEGEDHEGQAERKRGTRRRRRASGNSMKESEEEEEKEREIEKGSAQRERKG